MNRRRARVFASAPAEAARREGSPNSPELALVAASASATSQERRKRPHRLPAPIPAERLAGIAAELRALGPYRPPASVRAPATSGAPVVSSPTTSPARTIGAAESNRSGDAVARRRRRRAGVLGQKQVTATTELPATTPAVGSSAVVQLPSNPEQRYPEYMFAIERALESGQYRVDAERGIVYGLKGKPLKIKLSSSNFYPSVSLIVHGMRRPFYGAKIHKVVAYAIWGRAAFEPSVQVRHLNRDVLDARRANLALGTASDNSYDLPASVRVKTMRIARASQGVRGPSAKLSDEAAARLQAWARAEGLVLPNGRLKPGALRDICAALGMHRSAVSRAFHSDTDGQNRQAHGGSRERK